MNKRLPSYFIDLTQDACLRAYWRKDALRNFLAQHGIKQNILLSWGAEETKAVFLRRIFSALASQKDLIGHKAILKMANSLAEMKSFTDLTGWSDSSEKIQSAHRAVEKLRIELNKINDQLETEKLRNDIQKKSKDERERNISESQTLEKFQTKLQVLTEAATGGDRHDRLFSDLKLFFSESAYKRYLPEWFNGIWSLNLFWSFIKPKFDHYSERRGFLGEEFTPLLNVCQGTHSILSLQSGVIADFSSAGLNDCWRKMLERVESDPDGAITMARTTMETVLKHLADELDEGYSAQDDFSVLYKKVAKKLNLSPDGHTEEVFRSILGGCSAIAGGLGRIRNLYGDAHGQGAKQLRPAIRHARLAVNASATLCLFLIETYESRNKKYLM